MFRPTTNFELNETLKRATSSDTLSHQSLPPISSSLSLSLSLFGCTARRRCAVNNVAQLPASRWLLLDTAATMAALQAPYAAALC